MAEWLIIPKDRKGNELMTLESDLKISANKLAIGVDFDVEHIVDWSNTGYLPSTHYEVTLPADTEVVTEVGKNVKDTDGFGGPNMPVLASHIPPYNSPESYFNIYFRDKKGAIYRLEAEGTNLANNCIVPGLTTTIRPLTLDQLAIYRNNNPDLFPESWCPNTKAPADQCNFGGKIGDIIWRLSEEAAEFERSGEGKAWQFPIEKRYAKWQFPDGSPFDYSIDHIKTGKPIKEVHIKKVNEGLTSELKEISLSHTRGYSHY